MAIIPESLYMCNQLNQKLEGKQVVALEKRNIERHFLNIDDFNKLLKNKNLTKVLPFGEYIDLNFEGLTLSLNNSVTIRYYDQYQKDLNDFIIIFNDNSCISVSNINESNVHLHYGEWDNTRYTKCHNKIYPLDERFDKNYFLKLFHEANCEKSILEFFLQEENIFGLSKDIFLDIFYNASINPKECIKNLSAFDLGNLFYSLKSTIQEIYNLGGREDYTDIFGITGKYRSKFNYIFTCFKCEKVIAKEEFRNLLIYYCPHCQELHEDEVFDI